MEDLLVLFDKVQQSSSISVLAKEIVLVQNPGMQHWLNMQQAEMSGISMNASFVLPAQFLWQQLRLLSGDDVPEQAPYSREVLAWRIDELLQSRAITEHPDCHLANCYWGAFEQKDPLKRFQLAVQTADLYEQYLIYRPEWIHSWGKGEKAVGFDQSAQQQEQWQSHVWQCLHQQIAYDPCQLIVKANANLDTLKHLLPQRISIFGINALAPMWVDFLTLISEVVDVHFYHLNPCYEFWGDIKTDKQLAKQAYLEQINKWPEDPLTNDLSNPILANLGQQGREFLNLLHQAPNIEIPLFDELYNEQHLGSEHTQPVSVLSRLQKDILTLTDSRKSPIKAIDNSITITSAHSALREVQGLHDYLLHLFNENKELTPKDVLVMCPQIEQYAPYVDSVFVRGWEDIGESIPPLPCSIADRVSKDSEPLVAAFSELLSLPDSRFGVNQILAYLRLLPLQKRFDLDESDIELISDWLLKANVHWGLNAEHKSQMLNSEGANAQFTWEQGLNRLIMGFAYGDQRQVVDNDLMLEWVEGSDAIILGKLMLVCDQLKQMSQQFRQAKTASQWQSSLQHHLQALFVEVEHDSGFGLIEQAIDSLALYCTEAQYEGLINLDVVREFLNHHFSQPDPGRQFMIGQITFCSMLPMRSIPFKVLAVLGLNDGEFPRQRQPLGFDLMAITKAKPGDRSRRGDDRYLFLEALISARENLYLSYQGNDIRNNNERQPSIVLRELMDYLSHAYLWDFSKQGKANQTQLRRLPLQVFSLENYITTNTFQSFDGKWLALAQQNRANGSSADHSAKSCDTNDNASHIHLIEDDRNQSVTVEVRQLHAFLSNPCKYFAQQRLKLYFDQQDEQLDDAEPFGINFLEKYLYNQNTLQRAYCEQITDHLKPQTPLKSADMPCNNDDLLTQALLSGNFPDNPNMSSQLSQWQQLMRHFSQAIQSQVEQQSTLLKGNITACKRLAELIVYPTQDTAWKLQHDLDFVSDDTNALVFQYRASRAKAKDITWLYLSHLFTCLSQSNNQKVKSLGYFIDEKASTVEQYSFDYVDDANLQLSNILNYFLLGQSQALLLNSVLAERLFWQLKKSKNSSKSTGIYQDKDISQHEFEHYWQDENNISSLSNDPYIRYFWPKCPELSLHKNGLNEVYQDMFKQLNFKEFDLNDVPFIDNNSNQVNLTTVEVDQ